MMTKKTEENEKKESMGYYLYVPLVLITSFMLGCLSVSLVNVREGIDRLTSDGTVSASDAASREDPVRKSGVMESMGMRYRLVSAADLNIPVSKKDTAVETAAKPEPVSSEETAVSPSEHKSEETPAHTESISSETAPLPTESEEAPKKTLTLPNDHYINFTPPKEGYVAYLTFDDGPSENTEEILDILDYYNAKATFFVIYHKDMEEQYKAIAARGHTIGLHTYTHDYTKVYRSDKAFFNEINRISDYVYNLTGVRSKIIRFPGGSSNTVSRHYSEGIMDRLKKSVPEAGYVYHDWNVDSDDAQHNNLAPEKLLANIQKSLTKYRKPDILMHDTGESRHTTVEALPAIIEYIYSQGYTMERLELDSYAVHHNW